MNNKPENKLAFSVLATLTTGIALVYTFIMFHRIVFAVIGAGILFLITAYILTQNIIAYITMRNKSMNVQIKNYIDDISHQLETMNGEQSRLGKATYLYTRQAAEKVSNLENNYTESQAALYKNLSTITNTQNKATKLMIKYDLNNTTKLISTIKDMRNHLSETMVQGFDQIQPNNDDVVAVLNDIVSYLKSQPQQVNQGLSIQLNNVAHELQNISTSIQQVQVPANTVPTQASVNPTNYSAPSYTATDVVNTETVPTESTFDQEPVPEATNVIIEEAVMPETIMTEEAAPIQETASTDITENVTDTIPSVDTIEETITPDISATDIPATENTSEASANIIPDDTVAEPTEAAVAENPADDIPASDNISGIEGKSSNDMLSADEIAALFAAADPTPKKEEPVTEEAEEEEPFTPTFTVVGKSTDPVEEAEEPAKVATIGDVLASDDPNRQLSADEIAALFAAADPAPKKEEPVAAEVPTTPVTDDPNRQLSPDEIAALFAASEPTPKSDEEARIEEQKMDEALAAQAAAAPTVTPVSDDPNKQLSPDEIAALFASLG
ncbi:MAG: hypothetical protein J6A03_06990 [Lachnospiraceae bacterium]|nr:hypothetical protein [Lachnospiraceae bacterium]